MRGGVVGSQPVSTVQLCTWSQNKLWRSNSIFNLCPGDSRINGKLWSLPFERGGSTLSYGGSTWSLETRPWALKTNHGAIAASSEAKLGSLWSHIGSSCRRGISPWSLAIHSVDQKTRGAIEAHQGVMETRLGTIEASLYCSHGDLLWSLEGSTHCKWRVSENPI